MDNELSLILVKRVIQRLSILLGTLREAEYEKLANNVEQEIFSPLITAYDLMKRGE